MIVYGTPDPLFTAQVSFRRLYGNVAQQKLYLLQLTSSRMAEPRTLCRVEKNAESPGHYSCCQKLGRYSSE